METLHFYPQVWLRLPVRSRAEASKPMAIVINQPDFKKAVFLASETVYSELKKADFCWESCPPKLQHTLSKYYRRMCNRATPFGAFAALSFSQWGTKAQAITVMEGTLKLMTTLVQQPEHKRLYQLNPYLYRVANYYRFFNHLAAPNLYTLTQLHLKSIPTTWFKKLNSLTLAHIQQSLAKEGLQVDAAKNYLQELLNEDILRLKKQAPSYQSVSYPIAGLAPQHHDYVCAFQQTEGTLPISLQAELLEALQMLQALTSPCATGEDAIAIFTRRFRTLYDRRAVPLLEALDIEAGINYRDCQLFKGVISYPEATKTLLLKKWLANGNEQEAIVLNETDLVWPTATQKLKLPPGMVVLFERYAQQTWLRAAGGACATALLARFTLFDKELEQLCQSMAQTEQASNPAVIVADLGLEGAPMSLKINQRQAVNAYEIPLYGVASLHDSQVLPLQDLYLVLDGDQLIMRSKRLDKRIIPRLNSAYNYHHSNCSLLHFLGDLQYQGIHSSFSIALEALFPEQDYYPALRYKNILLAPEIWMIPAEEIQAIAVCDNAKVHQAFAEWTQLRNLPRHLLYEEHDQGMLIDSHDPESVKIALQHLRHQKGTIKLKAYPKDELGAHQVTNAAGNSYAAEYVAFLHNSQAVYHDNLQLPSPGDLNTKRSFFPLQDWYYVKIYIATAAMDDFLVEQLQPFISQQQSKGNLYLWHFLRYCDDAWHLRVRLKPVRESEGILLLALKQWIDQLEQEETIFNISLDTYEREIERYACIGPELAESLFQESSQWALKNIAAKLTEPELYLESAMILLQQLTPCLEDQSLISFCKVRADAYFSISNHNTYKKQFDDIYRSIQPLFAVLSESAAAQNPFISNYFVPLAQKLSKADYCNLIADYFHLQANRLFANRQHHHEACTYYLLQKWMSSNLARAKHKELSEKGDNFKEGGNEGLVECRNE